MYFLSQKINSSVKSTIFYVEVHFFPVYTVHLRPTVAFCAFISFNSGFRLLLAIVEGQAIIIKEC